MSIKSDFQKSTLSITRVQGGDKDQVNIRLVKNIFTGKPIDIRLSIEDFSKAVFGDIHIDCEIRKG